MDYLVNLNLNKNELQNAVIQPLATAPSNAKEGQIYYDSTEGDKQLYYFNGTSWLTVGAQKTATTPKMNGTAAIGSETTYAAGDHVHPSDTTKADKSTTVTNVAWDSTNNKITKTINGTTSDIVTISTLKTAIGDASTASNGLMTTTQVTKFNGIEEGAEVNQNAFSYIRVGNDIIDATTKTSNFQVTGMGNIKVSADSNVGNIIIGGVFYGTSDTSASSTTKLVTAPDFKLTTGSIIAVKFINTNSGAVASLQLDVNSTGAKSIKYRGGNLPSAGTLAANRVYFFVYDGTNYSLIGDLDTGEVNQNAFSNVKIGNTTIAADSKTDTIELVEGSNITLTPDATNDKVTIDVTDQVFIAEVGTTSYAEVTAALATSKVVFARVDSSDDRERYIDDWYLPLRENDEANNKYIFGTFSTNNRYWEVTLTNSGWNNQLTSYATQSYVQNAISSLPEPMIFKGSIGNNGTVTWANLPAAATGNEGWTYKVITAHTAETGKPAAKVGDTIISTGTEWVVIPSGDEPGGTVTNVEITNGGLISVSGSPITTTGTITLTHGTPSGASAISTAGFYKIKTDGYGHVNGTVAVQKSDLTTLIGNATQAASGLMSASDKSALDTLVSGALSTGTLTIASGQSSVSASTIASKLITFQAYQGGEAVVVDYGLVDGTMKFYIIGNATSDITIKYIATA